MSENNEPRLEHRIEKLEAENRRLKRWGAAALVAGVALAFVGAAPDPVPDVIDAHAFRLIDAQGQPRAILTMRPDRDRNGPVGEKAVLSFHDAKQRQSIYLGGDADGAAILSLGLSPKEGEPSVLLMSIPGESSSLTVRGPVPRSYSSISSYATRSLLMVAEPQDGEKTRVIGIGGPKGNGIDIVVFDHANGKSELKDPD